LPTSSSSINSRLLRLFVFEFASFLPLLNFVFCWTVIKHDRSIGRFLHRQSSSFFLVSAANSLHLNCRSLKLRYSDVTWRTYSLAV